MMRLRNCHFLACWYIMQVAGFHEFYWTFPHQKMKHNHHPPLHWKINPILWQLKTLQRNDSIKNPSIDSGHEYLNFTNKTILKRNWQLFHRSISSDVEHVKFQKASETVGKYLITWFMVSKLTRLNVWTRFFYFFLEVP